MCVFVCSGLIRLLLPIHDIPPSLPRIPPPMARHNGPTDSGRLKLYPPTSHLLQPNTRVPLYPHTNAKANAPPAIAAPVPAAHDSAVPPSDAAPSQVMISCVCVWACECKCVSACLFLFVCVEVGWEDGDWGPYACRRAQRQSCTCKHICSSASGGCGCWQEQGLGFRDGDLGLYHLHLGPAVAGKNRRDITQMARGQMPAARMLLETI